MLYLSCHFVCLKTREQADVLSRRMQMRATVQTSSVVSLRPEQRVPWHFQRLVQVPQLLRLSLLRFTSWISCNIAFTSYPEATSQSSTSWNSLEHKRANFRLVEWPFHSVTFSTISVYLLLSLLHSIDLKIYQFDGNVKRSWQWKQFVL